MAAEIYNPALDAQVMAPARLATSPYEVRIREKTAYTSGSQAAGFSSVGEIDAAQGLRLRKLPQGQAITSNALGEGTDVGWVYQGEKRFVELIVKELNFSMAKQLVFNEGLGDEGLMAPVGSLAQDAWGFEMKIGPLYTTTPAMDSNNETAAGNRIQWFKCCTLANGNEVEYTLKDQLAVVPLVIQVFPYWDTSNNVHRFWEYAADYTV